MNRKRYPSERLCTLCNIGLCEDELHFLLICPFLRDSRRLLLNPILCCNTELSNMSNPEKIIYLMQYCQHEVIDLIQKAWQIRSSRSINNYKHSQWLIIF